MFLLRAVCFLRGPFFAIGPSRRYRCALFAASFAMLLAACTGKDVSPDEVARVASPDGRVDAVLFESRGGATTPFAYDLHVVRHGEAIHGAAVLRLVGAVRNDAGASGANLRWLDAHTLIVEYLRARDAPPAESTSIVAGNSIRILVHSGITDAAAPSGGMWYNRKRMQDRH